MRDRILVSLVLLPVGLFLVFLGDWYYLAIMGFMITVASWEYGNLFRAGGFHPARFLLSGGVLALLVARHLLGFAWDTPILVTVTLLAMTVHLVDYERGGSFSGTDFAITLSGILYFGVLGGYLILLRNLPDGFWWFLTVLPAVWLADSGAYFYGRKFGRTRFSPRLSPKKTWEGYFAGVVTSTLGTGLLVLGWQALAGETISPTFLSGAAIGLVLSVITPLGDLGQSMIKRQVGIKDSGSILPGHGGMFDRIDTWIWSAVLGFYMVTWVFA